MEMQACRNVERIGRMKIRGNFNIIFTPYLTIRLLYLSDTCVNTVVNTDVKNINSHKLAIETSKYFDTLKFQHKHYGLCYNAAHTKDNKNCVNVKLIIVGLTLHQTNNRLLA